MLDSFEGSYIYSAFVPSLHPRPYKGLFLPKIVIYSILSLTEEVDLKTCTKCNEEKPASEFNKNKATKDGLASHCKECRKAYRKANREAIREYHRNYCEEYREANRAYHRKYSKENRDARRESSHKYREQNRDALREYSRKYYEQNREAILERKRKYREENREVIRARKEVRRREAGMPERGSKEFRIKMSLAAGGDGATFLDAPYTVSQLGTWAKHVKANWDHTCVMCGATENLHAHHMMPKSRYPEFALDLANGVCLCEECHQLQHA